jgi:hypothetical protein
VRGAVVLVALASVLLSCATVRAPVPPNAAVSPKASTATPAGIAANLDACLRSRTAFAPHLALACECVTRAEQNCQRAGFDRWCAWNGWDDRDHDSYTVGACLARRTP